MVKENPKCLLTRNGMKSTELWGAEQWVLSCLRMRQLALLCSAFALVSPLPSLTPTEHNVQDRNAPRSKLTQLKQSFGWKIQRWSHISFMRSSIFLLRPWSSPRPRWLLPGSPAPCCNDQPDRREDDAAAHRSGEPGPGWLWGVGAQRSSNREHEGAWHEERPLQTYVSLLMNKIM